MRDGAGNRLFKRSIGHLGGRFDVIKRPNNLTGWSETGQRRRCHTGSDSASASESPLRASAIIRRCSRIASHAPLGARAGARGPFQRSISATTSSAAPDSPVHSGRCLLARCQLCMCRESHQAAIPTLRPSTRLLHHCRTTSKPRVGALGARRRRSARPDAAALIPFDVGDSEDLRYPFDRHLSKRRM